MIFFHYFFIGLGGALGAISRAYITKMIDSRFPWSTLIVNFTGSLLVGIIIHLFSQADVVHLNEKWLATGFCGGFTTFSSFSHQTFLLFQSGKIILGMLNIFLSVGLCLIAVWLGLNIDKIF